MNVRIQLDIHSKTCGVAAIILVLMKPGKMTLKHQAVPATRYAVAGMILWLFTDKGMEGNG